MVNEIVICGDSFGCGIGLPFETCFEDSFGGIISRHYNVPHTVYAEVAVAITLSIYKLKKLSKTINTKINLLC